MHTKLECVVKFSIFASMISVVLTVIFPINVGVYPISLIIGMPNFVKSIIGSVKVELSCV